MNVLTWENPEWLHGWWILLLVGLVFWFRHRSRVRRLARLVPNGLRTDLVPSLRPGNSGRRTLLRLLACALLVSMTVLPMLAGRLLRPRRPAGAAARTRRRAPPAGGGAQGSMWHRQSLVPMVAREAAGRQASAYGT